jgi:hypothetical protein
MNDEPLPPDDLITEVTLKARMNADGIWTIYCPEWKCEMHGKSLTKPAAVILASIDDHNEETLQGEPDWFINPKKVLEEALGRKEWDRIQSEKRKNALTHRKLTTKSTS